MGIGDTIELYGVIYTVWLIEGNIYHLIDDDGNGRCYVQEFLLTLD
jgi:hypothetical protein